MFTGQVVGNVGGDPDMRYSTGGEPVLRFNVASNYRKRSAEGEWVDRVEWVRVIVFGKRAESLNEHDLIKKGVKVYVSGAVEAQPWTTNENEVRAGLQIIARDIELMGTGSAGGGGGDKGWGQDMTGQAPKRRPANDDQEPLEDLPF